MARQWIALAAVAVVCAAGQAGATTYDWRPGQGVPGVHGDVFAATTWDPDGAGPLPEWLVVAGYFDVAGDVAAKNVAAWDGQRWHNLGEGLPPYVNVYSLAAYEGDLLAGDWSGVYRLRGGIWQEMGGWPEIDGAMAMVVRDGLLFAGGFDGVSRWDGVHWQPVGTVPGEYVYITSLAVYNGELVAGGQFSDTGAAACILRWDGQDWQPLGAGLQCSLDADDFNRTPIITGLVILDGELIAAGNFHQSGEDTTCRYIARWDGQTWRPIGAPVDFFPQTIGVYGGKLVCGTTWFTDNSGRNGVAILDGAEWCFLPGTVWGTEAIVEYNGGLIIGGYGEIPGVSCSGIIRWDGRSWHALGEGISGYPTAMGTYDGDLLTAGWFSGFGDGAFSGVLRWDGQAWRPMGSELAGGGAPDPWVIAITEYNGDLLIAGRFIEAGGTTCNSLARWGGEDWQPFGGATRDGEPATIDTLFVHEGNLYVGGFFDTVGGVPCSAVARWDGQQWHDMGANLAGYWYWDDWNKEMRYVAPAVNCMATWNGQIVAGGTFALAEGGPLVNVARWDGQAWQAMGEGIRGQYTYVQMLKEYEGQLLAGGVFRPDPYDQDTVDTVPDMLAWDGQAWKPLGGLLQGFLGGTVTTYDGQLIVSGSFSGDSPAADLGRPVRWDGQRWHAMGDTLGTSCGLFEYNGDLIVWGGQVLAHGKVTSMLSRWGPVYAGDLNSDGHVDVVDLLILVDSFGKSFGEQGYDPACDLSADGTVDLADLMVMLDDWGK